MTRAERQQHVAETDIDARPRASIALRRDEPKAYAIGARRRFDRARIAELQQRIEDAKPPVELAVKYGQAHGLTPRLLSALRTFAEGLTGVGSVQANHVKRMIALVQVLDPGRAPRRGEACWSDAVAQVLTGVPEAERIAWHSFVLGLPLSDQWTPGQRWIAEAARLVGAVGPSTSVDRLAAWWPDPSAATVPIRTGGRAACEIATQFAAGTGTIAIFGAGRPSALSSICPSAAAVGEAA